MTCEDYTLPEWWHDDDVTDQERSDWMLQWRLYRQAMRQETAWARRMEQFIERQQRRQEARSETVDVDEWR